MRTVEVILSALQELDGEVADHDSGLHPLDAASFGLNLWFWYFKPPRRSETPKTRSRLPRIEPVMDALTRSINPARNATAAGVLCVKNRATQNGRVDTVIVAWDGTERVVPMACWAQGGTLSPNGMLIADMEYRPCREGHLRIVDRDGRSAAPPGMPEEGHPGGWIDDRHLVYRAPNDRLIVLLPLEAEGTFVARLPPDL